MKEAIEESIRNSISAKEGLLSQLDVIGQIADEICSACRKGNKLLICGNGGSAADSQHFAAELVGRFKKERKALPAISLTTDTSAMTAIGNDYGFEKVFSRQVEALGNEGDILIGISTSGNSKNIVEAVAEARRRKMRAICLLGNDGGLLKNKCDASLTIKSEDTPRIQESHILAIHIICDMVEQKLFGAK